MANDWITHVKKYAKDHNLKYGGAMSKAKASYKKGSPSKTHKGEEDFTTKKVVLERQQEGHLKNLKNKQ